MATKTEARKQETINPEELKTILKEKFTKLQKPMIREDYMEMVADEIRYYFVIKYNNQTFECEYKPDPNPKVEEKVRFTHTRAGIDIYLSKELAEDKVESFSFLFKKGHEAIVTLLIEQERIIIEHDYISKEGKESKDIEEVKIVDIKDVKIEERW